MKRFIRYLYEYEQGKRIRNVGFVKVETGNEGTTLHMQGKGFHKSGDRKLVLYLFYKENGRITGIRMKEMNLTTPVFSEQLSYDKNNVGTPDNYRKINGIIVETENGRQIAATWDDKPVDVSQMREYTSELNSEDMPAGREKENDGRDTQRSEELRPEGEPAGREEENDGRDTQRSEELRPEDEPAGRESEKAGHETQETEEYAQPERSAYAKIARKVTKIRRQDLAKLPRCEWKLANNHFLIHGYNNYHHLLMIEEGNVLKLGVPGIYHIKEARCADAFGFGEFLSAREIGISLAPEERHESEPFGYWCRPVKNYCNSVK